MKNIVKTYSSASNAKRAAKAAGHSPEQFDILSCPDGFYFEVRKATPAKKSAPAPSGKTSAGSGSPKSTPAKATSTPKPSVSTPAPSKPGPVAFEEKLAVAHTKALEEGTLVGGNGEAAIPLIRKSSITNPVEWVWNFFDEEKAAADKLGEKISRKGSIAKAVQRGIAFYTARTQYQSWKTANKY